jgi:DNA-binding transcriptional ArsR family regulator
LSTSSSPPGDAARELADVEAVFRALAHASRRQILLVLRFHGGQMTAGEIANRFACSWPTTTRHLRVLEEAGLVVVEPRGRERIYRLDAERLLAVTGGWTQWFAPLLPR